MTGHDKAPYGPKVDHTPPTVNVPKGACDCHVHVFGPDARYPLSLEEALWEEAARLAGDPFFGVRAARRLAVGSFGVIDYAIRSAPTLGEALAQIRRVAAVDAHDHEGLLGPPIPISVDFDRLTHIRGR